LDSVGIFIAEKWVDSVVSVERHSKRVLILKMVLDSGLLNVLMVYASHSGKLEEEKESFWNEVFHLGLDDIILVLQQNRLRWYGHVLRKEDKDWVKKCMEYEVEGARPTGRPKRTWMRDCGKRLSGT